MGSATCRFCKQDGIDPIASDFGISMKHVFVVNGRVRAKPSFWSESVFAGFFLTEPLQLLVRRKVDSSLQ